MVLLHEVSAFSNIPPPRVRKEFLSRRFEVVFDLRVEGTLEEMKTHRFDGRELVIDYFGGLHPVSESNGVDFWNCKVWTISSSSQEKLLPLLFFVRCRSVCNE